MQTLTFKNGDELAAIGLGTWKAAPGEVGKAVISALEAGYRHIDCAAIYGNEKEIGEAMKQAFGRGIARREDVWITSKLWNNAHGSDEVAPALRQTLSDLQLDYIDLYLIHWPVALQPGVGFPSSESDFRSLDQVPLLETWKAMEKVHSKGLARHVGVSNFSADKLAKLLEHADHAPEMDQVELHPYLQQDELLAYAMENGIFLTGYSPLGSRDRPDRLRKDEDPDLLDTKIIIEIAKQKGCSPAQAIIAWAVNRGTAVIPKSTNPGRIRENLEAGKIKLSKEEMNRIATLDKHYRFIDGGTWVEGNPFYSMDSLWDE